MGATKRARSRQKTGDGRNAIGVIASHGTIVKMPLLLGHSCTNTWQSCPMCVYGIPSLFLSRPTYATSGTEEFWARGSLWSFAIVSLKEHITTTAKIHSRKLAFSVHSVIWEIHGPSHAYFFVTTIASSLPLRHGLAYRWNPGLVRGILCVLISASAATCLSTPSILKSVYRSKLTWRTSAGL